MFLFVLIYWAFCVVVVVVVVVLTSDPLIDILGDFQVLHKTILVSPWEGREWPY